MTTNVKLQRTIDTFKKLCVEFVSGLVDILPNEVELMLAKTSLESMEMLNIPNEVLVTSFSKMLLPHKKQIKERNELFFRNNLMKIEVGGCTVSFKDIWKADIDKDDREQIWKYIDRFVELAEEYKKQL
jgi:hypothetical protein